MGSKILEENLSKESFNIKFNLGKTCYEAIENIGTGAYGVVCKACNKKTGQLVAIKKIPGAFESFIIAKRTYREIRILKNLKHENIILIRDILKPDNDNLNEFRDVYVVFDYMESDLHRVIHSKQELTDDHMKYLLYQILKGLKYLHSAKIIHRDLKPSNILVNENCDLKIGDFGMSRSVNMTSEEMKQLNLTQYVATRWYRAPELLYSCEYSYAIDLWSVGCIFSEMLTMRPLFPCKDAFGLIKVIFAYLGLPNKQFLKTIQSELFRNLIYAAVVKPVKKVNFREMHMKATDTGYNLLMRLLAIDQKERISASEALEHSYLTTYRDPITETNAEVVVDFDFEKQEFMADNGNAENLRKLKEAILGEADSYIPSSQIENEPQQSKTSPLPQTRSPLSEDLTQTILKIDEFLEKLNAEVTQAHPKQKRNNEEDTNDFLIDDNSRPLSRSSSIATTSNDSKIDVKSILKQKILDSAAKKINSNEKLKTKRKMKQRQSLKAPIASKPKAMITNTHSTVKTVPIRPKPLADNLVNNSTIFNSNLLPSNQIFIHSNQPIIILNGSLMHAQGAANNSKALASFTTLPTTSATNTQEPNQNTEIQPQYQPMNIEPKSNETFFQQEKSDKSQDINVTSLTKLLSKSKVIDNLNQNSDATPLSTLTLSRTPRGTADGYSIGVNYDNLAFEINGFSDEFNELMASAQLIEAGLPTDLSSIELGQVSQLQNIDFNRILETLDSPMLYSPS